MHFYLVSFDCVFIYTHFWLFSLNLSKETYLPDVFSLHVTKVWSVWNNWTVFILCVKFVQALASNSYHYLLLHFFILLPRDWQNKRLIGEMPLTFMNFLAIQDKMLWEVSMNAVFAQLQPLLLVCNTLFIIHNWCSRSKCCLCCFQASQSCGFCECLLLSFFLPPGFMWGSLRVLSFIL